MAHFQLSLDDLEGSTPATICAAIEASGRECTVDMPMPSIGTAGSHVSIAGDYGDALFVAETLFPFCSSLRVDLVPVREYFALMRFKANVKSTQRLCRRTLLVG